MWKEIQTLPPDGRQSEMALMIARGVRRRLRARGFSSVTISPSSTRERVQRFLKDPEIHVTAEPRFYEVALEVFPGWDVS